MLNSFLCIHPLHFELYRKLNSFQKSGIDSLDCYPVTEFWGDILQNFRCYLQGDQLFAYQSFSRFVVVILGISVRGRISTVLVGFCCLHGQ